MSEEETAREKAQSLFHRAYHLQMEQQFEEAIELYNQSILLFPTAEAYTFLGWTYSMMGKLQDAMDYCRRAIEVDPDFGNPYNDIGAYLIELKQWDEAIPWLVKAINAKRYATPQFPLMNLGRVYEHHGDWLTAVGFYNQALEIDPLYLTAMWAKYGLLGRIN